LKLLLYFQPDYLSATFMTDYELRIQELQAEVMALQKENLDLKRSQRQEIDQRDISDAANEMLRLGQLRYRTVFENSLLGNKIISSDLKILQVNQTLVGMLGCANKEELIGRRILEFAHPDFVNDWHILQQKLWSKNLPSFNLETCLVRKNGDSIWVNVISTLFRDGGEYLGYTTIEDIGERKSNLDVLRVREEKFRTITNIMPQQVWTATPGGHLNFINQQVCDYLGMSSEELIQNGWEKFIYPEDVEKCRNAWAKSIKTGDEYAVEFRFSDKHGNYRWHLGRATSLRDDDGAITLWLGTNTDIQVQKDNEQRKDEFLSIVSHELKTPLTSIKLYNQLSQKIELPEKRMDFIEKSTAHIARLERLIQDLLDVSRINAGKMAYNIETFDFDSLLRQTVEGVQAITEKHELVIEASEPVEVKGDHHRIEQVLNNLLLNAVKYSPDADRVVIKSQIIADAVIVSVQDFGIGIEEKDLTRLFDRYYRSDNTQMRFDGLGLGLFISAEILKRHNGSLWIESKLGEGSTFNFLLPKNGQQRLRDIDTDHQTYYTGNFLTIQFNAEMGWLEADWIGYQNFESVKKGCLIMLDLLKKNQCSQVLNDNSKVMGNWSEASDWGATYWFPAMQQAGLEQFAWVYSASAFSRLAANKSIATARHGFETEFFTDKTAAIEWLTQKS
jgi:PAS domain S-box-containing protein